MDRVIRKQRKYNYKKRHEFHGNQYTYKTKYKKRIPVTLRHKLYHPQLIKRLTKLDFARITKMSKDGHSYRMIGMSGNSLDSTENNVMLLRPRTSGRSAMCVKYINKDTNDDNSCTEMRLINNDKATSMWNTSIIEHSQTNCDNIHLKIVKEEKQGLCWRQTLGCKNCKYTSKSFKLYHEVDTRER